ncbi:lactococcin 972 family bacteriocin [Adlercreutzia caecimuris]|uniref:lactococcin 972 family bacteriocin n=1 Tax=Adlercreutzia caecimuris TaxID=671266 RepID=UPI00249486A9|nr:lactococcin 972 family bacteriocin [Adlercreutzia caecimuris]
MKKVKVMGLCVVMTLSLTCVLGATPALAASASKGNVPMNKIYNTSILGGTWHNKGSLTKAYSNFYHKTKQHTSTVGSSASFTTKTASAKAGSWSYATLSQGFPAKTTFKFKCTTS